MSNELKDLDNKPLAEEKFEDKDEESYDADEEPYRLEIPPKDRQLITHPFDFIVRSLNDQIKDGSIILADKFQRRQVWNDIKCSRLIESLLINVPIPVCYFAELENMQYSVIDGQQRLSAIYRYLNNTYALRGLKIRDDINKKRFFELDLEDQRHILLRTLRCIVILKESDPNIRFDVFERLNTNSVQLRPQELRNCVYRGKLNDIIKKLSEDADFQYIRGTSGLDLRMGDVEMVLRFFAFYERLPSYGGNLRKFLDEYQKDGMNKDDKDLIKLESLFHRVISDAKYLFENKAFRRFSSEKGTWEDSVNRAVYDSVMICFSKAESNEIRAHKQEICDGLKELCRSNQDFIDAIESATPHRNKVKNRLKNFREMMVSKGVEVERISYWNEE